MLNVARAETVGRSTVLANTLEELRAQLPFATAQATGVPLPPAPSRALPISLIAGGALVAVAGGLVGLDALARDRALTQTFQTGQAVPQVLDSRAAYDQEIRTIGDERTLAVVGLSAGAAVIATGLWVLRSDDSPSRSRAPVAALTVELAPRGFALTGRF